MREAIALARARVLYATCAFLWVLALVFAWPSHVLLAAAHRVRWASDRCLDRAREWDPRLYQRGGHTDLGRKPGA